MFTTPWLELELSLILTSSGLGALVAFDSE